MTLNNAEKTSMHIDTYICAHSMHTINTRILIDMSHFGLGKLQT